MHFARGEFAQAAQYFQRSIMNPPNAGELAGSTDWLWMSYMRAGMRDSARALLARRPDSLPIANAYAARLRLYRGETGPDQVITPADTADVQVATLSFGVGNWYLVRGDTAQALAWFERSVRSGGWPGFGFIISEVELRRLRNRGAGSDAAFAGVQERGRGVMGVDQFTSQHVFESLPTGGRIVLQRDDASDTAAVRTIRAHMREILSDVRAGDFSKPFQVHAMTVPGTGVMSARRDAISYAVSDLPRGAELRIQTRDAQALRAIHEFLAFQRSDHRAAGHQHKP